jgi:hypothetical protein
VAVTIHSPAPATEVQRLVDHANRLSPMLANLSRDIEQVHHLTVVPLVPSEVPLAVAHRSAAEGSE